MLEDGCGDKSLYRKILKDWAGEVPGIVQLDTGQPLYIEDRLLEAEDTFGCWQLWAVTARAYDNSLVSYGADVCDGEYAGGLFRLGER